MGPQRLAELRDYWLSSAGNILDRVEVWEFAGGVGIGPMESQGNTGPAGTVLAQGWPLIKIGSLLTIDIGIKHCMVIL